MKSREGLEQSLRKWYAPWEKEPPGYYEKYGRQKEQPFPWSETPDLIQEKRNLCLKDGARIGIPDAWAKSTI